MAKTIKSNNGAKLSAGYKATLWVIGIVLFLAFAFATFCAFGGIDLIDKVEGQYGVQQDEEGKYFITDDAGNIIYLDDLVTSTSGGDVPTNTDANSVTGDAATSDNTEGSADGADGAAATE